MERVRGQAVHPRGCVERARLHGDRRRRAAPLDRAETHGFRCIKESTPSETAAYAPQAAGSRPTRDFTKEKPVDAEAFEIFRRFYSYDRTPLDPRVERTEEAEHWRRERVSFAAAYGGERVLANILLPKNAAPPYQTVIWFPGSYALNLKSSDRDLVFSYYFDFLPRSGRALVYPVYKGTYERQTPFVSRSQLRDLVIQWSKDLGRTIDYLESRNDFDRDKFAYYGFSLGADNALPTIALEPRLKAAILLAGGMDREVRLPEVEPLNFLTRIKVPVLLLAGRNDFYFPVETSQAPLFKLLGTPARAQEARGLRGRGPRATPDRCDSRNPGLAGPLPRAGWEIGSRARGRSRPDKLEPSATNPTSLCLREGAQFAVFAETFEDSVDGRLTRICVVSTVRANSTRGC